MSDTKRCSKCLTVKPATDFYAKTARCKPCANAIGRSYYRRTKAKCRERQKRWSAANRDKMRACAKRWRQRHPTMAAALARRYYSKIREQMFAVYGSVCLCCGETERRFLTLEHENHDGAAHRRSVGTQIYKDLRRRGWPKAGYSILCMNCNFAERYGHPCPHKARLRLVEIVG